MPEAHPQSTLQQLFLQSKGDPIRLNRWTIIQMDRIKIQSGAVTIIFDGTEVPGTFGVALKAKNGGILLANGRRVSLLHVWDEPGLPRQVSYRVDCSQGELRVWNVYRTQHQHGFITEDAWTGNAGMLVEKLETTLRRYRCSSGPGAFTPNEFTFLLRWSEGG